MEIKIKHSFCVIAAVLLIMDGVNSSENPNQNTKELSDQKIQSEMHNPLKNINSTEKENTTALKHTSRVKRQFGYYGDGYYYPRPYPLPIFIGGGGFFGRGFGIGYGFGGRGFGGRGFGGRGFGGRGFGGRGVGGRGIGGRGIGGIGGRGIGGGRGGGRG